MNSFDQKLVEHGNYPLVAKDISILQVNMGYRRNLTCTHCHVEASPSRSEEMSSKTVDQIFNVITKHEAIVTLDITGGFRLLRLYTTENPLIAAGA